MGQLVLVNSVCYLFTCSKDTQEIFVWETPLHEAYMKIGTQKGGHLSLLQREVMYRNRNGWKHSESENISVWVADCRKPLVLSLIPSVHSFILHLSLLKIYSVLEWVVTMTGLMTYRAQSYQRERSDRELSPPMISLLQCVARVIGWLDSTFDLIAGRMDSSMRQVSSPSAIREEWVSLWFTESIHSPERGPQIMGCNAHL